MLSRQRTADSWQEKRVKLKIYQLLAASCPLEKRSVAVSN